MRLLVIDDNRRLSEYVGVALRGQGFAVDSVETGADAEAAISTTSYDAIILDLGLPDIDGLAWLEQTCAGVSTKRPSSSSPRATACKISCSA